MSVECDGVPIVPASEQLTTRKTAKACGLLQLADILNFSIENIEIVLNRMKRIRLIFDGKWVGGYRGGLVLEVRMRVNASGMLRMLDQPIF